MSDTASNSSNEVKFRDGNCVTYVRQKFHRQLGECIFFYPAYIFWAVRPRFDEKKLLIFCERFSFLVNAYINGKFPLPNPHSFEQRFWLTISHKSTHMWLPLYCSLVSILHIDALWSWWTQISSFFAPTARVFSNQLSLPGQMVYFLSSLRYFSLFDFPATNYSCCSVREAEKVSFFKGSTQSGKSLYESVEGYWNFFFHYLRISKTVLILFNGLVRSGQNSFAFWWYKLHHHSVKASILS